MSDQAHTIHFGWKKTVVYSLLPVVVLFGLLESASRLIEIAWPPLPVDFGWGFDPDSRLFVHRERDDALFVTNPSKEVSFPKQSFRVPKPKSVFRVFMLGGSSVNYVEWALKPSAMRLTLKAGGSPVFEIIDAGGCAYGTHRLAGVAAEIMAYQPDLLLIYSGHNEFEELEQLDLVRLSTLPLQKIIYKSALCRFIRDRFAAITISKLRRERQRRILGKPEADYLSGARHHYSQPEIRERMDAYRNNLALIISLCRDNDVAIILGTVPSNLWRPDLPEDAMEQRARTMYDNGEYEQGLDYVRKILGASERHQASDVENGIIRSLAEEFGVPLADVEARVIAAEPHNVPGETLFSDRCHLTAAGNEILIATFEEQILALIESLPAHFLELQIKVE